MPVRLLPPRRPGPAAPGARAAPFHLLAKPTGAICNLDCEYCFYLSKEALYPGDRFRMADGMLETYLRQLFAAHPPGEVVVAWQGGEPTLMGVDFFRRAVALAEGLRRPDQRVRHTLQTNGTLLDDEWCELLAEHGFLVGVSIDGPPELHDRYRVDKRGRPTSARVRRGLALLQRHQVDVNALCTVNAANEAEPLGVYRHVRDELGLRHLQLIPIVERAPLGAEGRPGGVTARSVDPAAWGAFLVAVFDEWLAHDVGEVFVQPIEAAVASWCGLPPGQCVFEPTCGSALALEHNGDVYACDHFVEPEHLLGNLASAQLSELLASPAQAAFGQAKAALPGYCVRCEVRFACNGECPKNRFLETPDGEGGLNYLCAGYRAFFNHVDGPLRLVADLLRHGRPADEITGVFASAPRNGPCPCGSGRKAKHCHGRPDASAARGGPPPGAPPGGARRP